jgi:hypothetical protein
MRAISVFHALPLSGYTDEEIKTRIEKEDAEIKQLFESCGIDIVILHPHMEPITDKLEIHQTRHMNLKYFGLSLAEGNSKADIVCFGHDWRKAKGCVTEQFICATYDIPYVELEKQYTSEYVNHIVKHAIGWHESDE